GTSDNSTNNKQGYLSHGSTFTSHTDFVIAVQEYAIREGFTMRLHKLKRNKAGAVRWREIVCSRNGTSSKKKESGNKPTRNRRSQRCKCPFLVRAAVNGTSGLWEIISTKLEHNHDIGNTASLDNFSFMDLSSVNNKTQFKSQQSSALPKIPTVEWKPLLPESCLKEKHFSETLSREEMFVKERRRLALQGIASYQFDSRSGQILFNYGSGIYLGHVSKNAEFYPRPIIPYSQNSVTCSGSLMNFSLAQSPQNNRISPLSSPSTNSSSPSSPCPSLNNTLPPRLDPKLGGRNCDLVAFIRDRDIWVTTLNGLETQLTFCNEHDPDGSSALSCGVAEFVMQEEFHRFTGYYWAPSSVSTSIEEHVERILYLQISESMVDLVLIPRPGQQGEAEEYRYPKAGTPNAASDLQIVEFIPRYNEDEEVTTSPVHKRLWGPAALDKLFPWKEYIVRFGWCPNGKR
ncbi:15838_t:CDS:2, partial [Racocetra fulgida]